MGYGRTVRQFSKNGILRTGFDGKKNARETPIKLIGFVSLSL